MTSLRGTLAAYHHFPVVAGLCITQPQSSSIYVSGLSLTLVIYVKAASSLRLPTCLPPSYCSSLSRRIAASWLELGKPQRTVWLLTNHFHEDFSHTDRLIPKGSVGWANVTSVTVFLESLEALEDLTQLQGKGALFPTLRTPRDTSYHFHGVHSVFDFLKYYFAFIWSSLPLLVSISVVCQCHNLAIALA